MSTFAPKCILVTGGGSGIGAGLAQALHKRGCRVIIAGPTRDKLEALAARNDGMTYEVLDVSSAEAVSAFAAAISSRNPELDSVINSAGVQNLFDFTGEVDPAAAAREVAINLSGTVNIAAAFLPLLRNRPSGSLVLVGSGLGYVPLAAAPIYSATKAAVHSFAISLRWQLENGPVRVVEIVPPVVETALHRNQSKRPPRAMSLDAFVAAAMKGLDAGRGEIDVGLARVLRAGSKMAPNFFLKVVNRSS